MTTVVDIERVFDLPKQSRQIVECHPILPKPLPGDLQQGIARHDARPVFVVLVIGAFELLGAQRLRVRQILVGLEEVIVLDRWRDTVDPSAGIPETMSSTISP